MYLNIVRLWQPNFWGYWDIIPEVFIAFFNFLFSYFDHFLSTFLKLFLFQVFEQCSSAILCDATVRILAGSGNETNSNAHHSWKSEVNSAGIRYLYRRTRRQRHFSWFTILLIYVICILVLRPLNHFVLQLFHGHQHGEARNQKRNSTKKRLEKLRK